jgi:hypothetical protein
MALMHRSSRFAQAAAPGLGAGVLCRAFAIEGRHGSVRHGALLDWARALKQLGHKAVPVHRRIHSLSRSQLGEANA